MRRLLALAGVIAAVTTAAAPFARTAGSRAGDGSRPHHLSPGSTEPCLTRSTPPELSVLPSGSPRKHAAH